MNSIGFLFWFVCKNLVENSLKLMEQNLLDTYQLPLMTDLSQETNELRLRKTASCLMSLGSHK